MTITKYSGSGTGVGLTINTKNYLYQVPTGKIAKVKFNVYFEYSNTQNSNIARSLILFCDSASTADKLGITNSVQNDTTLTTSSIQFGIADTRLLGSGTSNQSLHPSFTANLHSHPVSEGNIIGIIEYNNTTQTDTLITDTKFAVAQVQNTTIVADSRLARVLKNEFILVEGEGVWVHVNSTSSSLKYTYNFTVIEEDL